MNTRILDGNWCSEQIFLEFPLICPGSFLCLGFGGFFNLFLSLHIVQFMEFREWGDIILCPICKWIAVSTVRVGWNEPVMYFFFRSVRFWSGDFLLLPDPVLIFILLSVFPLQMQQQTCTGGKKGYTCPDLKRKLLYTSWRFTEEQLPCWFGGGWVTNNNQKRNATTHFALHFIRIIMLVLFKASLSVLFCQYISNPASSGTSQLNPKFTCQSIPSMFLPYSGAKFFIFLGLVQEETLTINNDEDLCAGN